MAKETRKLYPSEEKDRFMVRLPDGMRDKLKAVADANKRTMNAEIVARLERTIAEDAQRTDTGMKWVAKAKEASTVDVRDRLYELEQRMTALETILKRRQLL
ncbi:Arc family DNA-binding protein [Phyllobacterium phragmitis]|uniref:Arc-like DNA binding domain-containing protein n=1 Tax=Phyllobacterium phragmitis TaxID=2670329 RepID=A0ABQ0GYJ0_9HYPH